ncbi:putative programmed cell death 2 [Cryptosporidium canis]|nr:putative programmed cell death 2 [Cryptosporidium canis]
MSDVLLGYLEKPGSPIVLDSRYFPSKFGGRPAWLNPQNLPRYRDLQCSSCGARMRFLLQVYAPQDHREDLFHRSIFVFICTNCTCSVQAFRCQLPRRNDYYDFNPAPVPFSLDDHPSEKEISGLKELSFNSVCTVCGLPLCSESKDKQSGVHDRCSAVSHGDDRPLLDEFLLDIEICSTDEDEDEDESDDDEQLEEEVDNEEAGPESEDADTSQGEPSVGSSGPGDELQQEQRVQTEKKHFENIDRQEVDPQSSEYRLFQSYKQKFSESIDNVLDDSEMKAFGKLSNASTEKDAAFEQFISKSRKYQGHVIRYTHQGSPLWISDKNVPQEPPPNCPLCRSPRTFEFQVQPEVIVLGNLPSKIEFGVIAVFTCSNSCSTSEYVPEFVQIQVNPY